MLVTILIFHCMFTVHEIQLASKDSRAQPYILEVVLLPFLTLDWILKKKEDIKLMISSLHIHLLILELFQSFQL